MICFFYIIGSSRDRFWKSDFRWQKPH